ncbi:hypothetical protein Y032_0082g1590 [Ancylostoma ceylanicum]|uniref:Uncharacterized protein n=1 Tax=Ancylostoma ceylanicum TaxID=53326 RepID=A0A016TRS9_9BILA|nr:hypothetical protein Y032_0082g1590 [Ancylostoma ceylanicum]
MDGDDAPDADDADQQYPGGDDPPTADEKKIAKEEGVLYSATTWRTQPQPCRREREAGPAQDAERKIPQIRSGNLYNYVSNEE